MSPLRRFRIDISWNGLSNNNWRRYDTREEQKIIIKRDRSTDRIFFSVRCNTVCTVLRIYFAYFAFNHNVELALRLTDESGLAFRGNSLRYLLLLTTEINANAQNYYYFKVLFMRVSKVVFETISETGSMNFVCLKINFLWAIMLEVLEFLWERNFPCFFLFSFFFMKHHVNSAEKDIAVSRRLSWDAGCCSCPRFRMCMNHARNCRNSNLITSHKKKNTPRGVFSQV